MKGDTKMNLLKKKRQNSPEPQSVKSKKSSETLLSKGIMLLIFIMLSVQFFYFIREMAKEREREAVTEMAVKSDIPDSLSGGISEKRGGKSTTSLPNSDRRQGSGESKTEQREHLPTQAVSETESRKDHGEKRKRTSYDDYDGWKWDMVELNSADSTALESLPGIGPYYAKQIIRYREKLWGCYADLSQLLEIRGIDTSLLRKIERRLYIEPASIRYMDLRTLSADSLATHPYIGSYSARGIERYRRIHGTDSLTVGRLRELNILSPSQAARLSRYLQK